MKKIQLKGITWNHSRGLVPMVATGQRFSEMHPNVEITWEKRSLQAFADASVDELALHYDLLVIDHPWAGFAAQTESVLPLDRYLPQRYMADQRQNSVGKSFESYTYQGHQWALALDAATPVAASRPDLLELHNKKLPKNFRDLMDLATNGLVGFSLIPIDALMTFYMFCCSLGEPPCQQRTEVVSNHTGVEALIFFKALTDKVDRRFFEANPIAVYEIMSGSNDIAYCPFAYGYSNYARNGYGRHVLHFHDLIELENKSILQSTLGGAGLAVSAYSKNIQIALEYARYTASPGCQITLYVENGGQPGHRSAWQSKHANNLTNNYFADTLPALERAFLRPRYAGHLSFQDHAGDPIRNYLLNGGEEVEVLDTINQLYIKSLTI